jgi:hypothetical protein
MLFHFDFANYLRMLRLAWNERNPRARRYYLLVLLVSVPFISSFHAICFLLDGLLFPGLWKTRIRTPVFVVGHARSGTTLVHRLMSKDEGRFSSFLMYELYFPSLLQKKAIRCLAGLDRRHLGGFFERRVRAWEEKRYGAMRGVHKMGLTEPEEDDLVFYYSCASGFWITKMPYMGDLDFYHVDRWPLRRRRRLLRFYRDCVRRQLYLNGGDKIHLSKNPVFAGRVASLIEAFPDARIVVPLRNPYDTIPSLLKLVRMGWRHLDWDDERQKRCLRILAEQSFDTYRDPLEVIARHPQTPHAILDYRDVVADPAATIERTYQQLGFPMSPEYRELLLAEGARARQHVSGHSYSLEEFGLEADAIRSRLADLFEQYRWDEADGGAGSGPDKQGEG